MTANLGLKTDCWKTIGVWGRERPRCEKLAEVVHCRNCDVFTQAGRNLLERELPVAYMQEWTQVFAAKKPAELLGTVSVLIFRIEQEWLALPAHLFAEVIDPAPVHSMPHRHNPVLLGVANVHGEVQLCVSLKALLGIDTPVEKKPARRGYRRMMVLERNAKRWVFAVDEIHGIHRVHPSLLENIPVTVSKSGAGFSKGIFNWEDRHVALLDEELLFYKLSRSVQ